MRMEWIIVGAILVFIVYRAFKTHFVCPECRRSFKAGAWKYMFTIHLLGKRMVKCPHCGHTELMRPYWDEK